jgi:hypothetical protein
MKGKADFSKPPSGIFLQGGLANQISLNRLVKLVFTRRPYLSVYRVLVEWERMLSLRREPQKFKSVDVCPIARSGLTLDITALAGQ